ncbi:hypothetical protein [Solibacillus sp. CAU 1738]|uniref:hypothetical protein n=1 Tax=Solibacillus sp. CAU 1738 TaxID=3140363 RepID=UPI0032601E2C
MNNDKRPSLKFFAAAMVGVMVAPLIMLLGPPIMVETMYFDKDHIVLMTPWSNFILLALALVLIIINLFLLAWKRNKIMYILTGFLIVASVICAIQSTKNYTSIHDTGVILVHYGKEQHYDWNDFEQIIYFYDSSYGGLGQYEFTLKTGEKFKIEETGQFINEVRNLIYRIVRENNIVYLEQPLEK